MESRSTDMTFIAKSPSINILSIFFCYKLQLALECGGYLHEMVEVWKKDIGKTNQSNQLEVRITRFFDYQIMNAMENVIRAIEDSILTFEENDFTPSSVPLH